MKKIFAVLSILVSCVGNAQSETFPQIRAGSPMECTDWISEYGFGIGVWYYPPEYNILGYWYCGAWVTPVSLKQFNQEMQQEMNKWDKYIEYYERQEINQIDNWNAL